MFLLKSSNNPTAPALGENTDFKRMPQETAVPLRHKEMKSAYKFCVSKYIVVLFHSQHLRCSLNLNHKFLKTEDDENSGWREMTDYFRC